MGQAPKRPARQSCGRISPRPWQMVKERAKVDKKIDHFMKASEPLDWPSLRVSPDMATDQSLQRRGILRSTLVQSGKDFLKWERPPTRALPLPDGQRLLATGEVVHDDENGSASAI